MKPLAEESKTSGVESFAVASQGPLDPAILMVDDQPARLLTYEAVLSGMPVRCVRANSGEDALQLLLKQPFALILLDVNMPRMDGFEVARTVRAHERLGKIPIIFVSGERLDDLDRLKGYEVGAIDYISVPVVPEILRSKVALLIELYHRKAELEDLSRAAAEARSRATGVEQPGATATQLRAFFDQTPDIKFILRGERDAQGGLSAWRYVDANASALQLYRRSREDVVGRTVQEVFPERAARAEMLCKRALQGERLQYETDYDNRQLLVRVFAVDDASVALTCTDITERKRTEHALANSERRFQALLEGCPVGVAQVGMDGRFQYVNAGFCDIVGYDADELFGMTWQQITHPDDLLADQSLAGHVLAGAIPHYTMEKRYLRKDGTPVWVSMFGNFIFDDQRLPVQGVAVVVDISARKLADDAVHDSRKRLLLAHEAAGLGSFDWDISRDTATWDTRARALWGVASDVRLDRATALAGVHPEDRATTQRELDRALEPAHGGRYLAQYRVINAIDGSVRWVESHGQVIFEGQIPVRMVGTLSDISARIDAERSLRESEERFRELANNIDQIVWTCDAQGNPTWFNDRWYEFSGARFELMTGEGWSSLVHPDHASRIVNRFRECIAAGETWEETFPVRGRNGEYRWFLSRAIPIESPDGKVTRWFGTNTDITDQRQLQDALTEADRRKDEFLAILAHELRNPVAPIVNVAQILSRRIEDKQLAGLVGIVRRQSAHLTRLLDDLLDVARITRGRIELRREICDLNDCIPAASETVEPLLQEKRQRLEVSLAPGGLRVNVDRVRITQCVTNLLNNASKFSAAGTVIRIRTRAEHGAAIIEVADEGRGIAPEVLGSIFELFSQGQRPPDHGSGGLGIGLSVCRKLIEMHDGSIHAYSEGVGRGSRFALKLPLLAPVAGEGPAPRTEQSSARRKVFIVDDNRDAADSIAMLLHMSGHEVRVSYDGREAIALCRDYAPDVLLLDIGLPGLDGYQVIRELRAEGFSGYAIALSGYGQPEDTRRALSSGFDAHVTKPVEIEVLEQAMLRAPRGS